jgi:hypothetical protein
MPWMTYFSTAAIAEITVYTKLYVSCHYGCTSQIVLVTKYYKVDQIEEDEMGRACLQNLRELFNEVV